MRSKLRKVCVNAASCRAFDRATIIASATRECPSCGQPLRDVDSELEARRRFPRVLALAVVSVALIVAAQRPLTDWMLQQEDLRQDQMTRVTDVVVLRSLKSGEESAQRIMAQLELRRRFVAVAKLTSVRTAAEGNANEELIRRKTVEIGLDIRRYQIVLGEIQRLPRDIVARVEVSLPVEATELDLLESSASGLFRVHLHELLGNRLNPRDTARVTGDFDTMFAEAMAKRSK